MLSGLIYILSSDSKTLGMHSTYPISLDLFANRDDAALAWAHDQQPFPRDDHAPEWRAPNARPNAVAEHPKFAADRLHAPQHLLLAAARPGAARQQPAHAVLVCADAARRPAAARLRPERGAVGRARASAWMMALQLL